MVDGDLNRGRLPGGWLGVFAVGGIVNGLCMAVHKVGGTFNQVGCRAAHEDDPDIAVVLAHDIPAMLVGVCEGEMLLGQDAARDTRAEHAVDETVQLLRSIVMRRTLGDTQREAGHDELTVVEEVVQHLAKVLVVVQIFNRRALAQLLKRAPVEAVNKLYMRIGAYEKGQLLEVANAVCETDEELVAHPVGRFHETIVGHLSSKEDILAQGAGIDGLPGVFLEDFGLVEMVG